MPRAFAPRIAFVLLTSGFVTAGQSTAAIAAADTCVAASVWVSPRVVNYGTVIRSTGRHGSEPSFTVFIELPDGSAADIDPESITLNGLPALPEPGGVGDANLNGIADLKVKFDRSALITTEGILRFTGDTRSGGCFTGETTVEIIWCHVERSDYFLDFTTSNMPDGNLNGLSAQLDVHRVRPGGCPTAAALVLVHGRTFGATADFDLQYQDYSLMERLAMRGIDTFAANHLGFGFSSLPSESNPLDNPCNASLPQCPDGADGICTPSETCDCRRGLSELLYPMDQQGSTRYLNPNPLTARCAHTSSTHFQVVTDQVDQLDLIVNDALAKTGLQEVYLLGLSLGGSTIGKYLGVDVSHQDKVRGAVFLASTFRGTQGMPSATWPLGLIDRADAMKNFNLAGPTCQPGDGCVPFGCTPADPDCAKGLTGCPGQQGPEIQDALWDAIKARDPVGAGWGPQPGGLHRYPVVPRFGWDETVTSRIEVPALVMNGLKDNVVRVPASVEIWSSSPLQVPATTCATDAQCAPGYACRSFPAPARCRLNNRILQQLDCASHALLWESCSGEGCVDPHRTVQKRVGDWILTGK